MIIALAMGVTVYEAPHTTRHIAGRCSCAYVIWLGMTVASVIVPYMVAYHTRKLADASSARPRARNSALCREIIVVARQEQERSLRAI